MGRLASANRIASSTLAHLMDTLGVDIKYAIWLRDEAQAVLDDAEGKDE